ncbi:DUF296-containing protein [Aureococcus anophagefferens]|nr:DUF296-containing protein [Aureococcus anophagefferens]
MDEQSPPPPLITPRRITFGDSHSDEIDAVAKRRRLGRPPEIRVELLDRDATGNLVPARGERLGAPAGRRARRCDVVPTRGDDALPLARVGFARLESERLHDVLYATPELLRSDADRLPAARVDLDALLRADDLAELARDAAPAGLDAELRQELLHADVLLRLAPTLDAADERAASVALARVVEEIEERVAAGASVDGACLLHVAVEKRVLPLVPLLVDVHGADVNRFDANGLTPLMCAAHRLGFAATSLEDTLAVCGLLVARGADAGLADGCGLTALGHSTSAAPWWTTTARLGERRRGVHLELAALLVPRGGPTPADEHARLAASGVDVADVVPRLGEVPGDFEARDGAGVACACGALATGTHFVARGGGAAPLGPAGGAAFGPGYRDLDSASVVRAPPPPAGTVVSVARPSASARRASARTPPRSAREPAAARMYALRLRPGEELLSTLKAFCFDRGLASAYVATCVGSLQKATLRLANADRHSPNEIRSYEQRRDHAVGRHDLATAARTSTLGAAGACVGGHLISGEIFTTAEIVVGTVAARPSRREHDDATGFPELVVVGAREPRRRAGRAAIAGLALLALAAALRRRR